MPASRETRIIIITMLISGALAGMMALNPIMGDQHRVPLDFVAGAGFVGIAVALMGRSHPAGIVPAAILFGMLYQGGAELAFEMPNIIARHDRHHPGPGHPVRRRAGAHVPARRSRRCSPRSARARSALPAAKGEGA